MKTLKKILVFVLAFFVTSTVAFSFVGCGKKDSANNGTDTEQTDGEKGDSKGDDTTPDVDPTGKKTLTPYELNETTVKLANRLNALYDVDDELRPLNFITSGVETTDYKATVTTALTYVNGGETIKFNETVSSFNNSTKAMYRKVVNGATSGYDFVIDGEFTKNYIVSGNKVYSTYNSYDAEEFDEGTLFELSCIDKPAYVLVEFADIIYDLFDENGELVSNKVVASGYTLDGKTYLTYTDPTLHITLVDTHKYLSSRLIEEGYEYDTILYSSQGVKRQFTPTITIELKDNNITAYTVNLVSTDGKLSVNFNIVLTSNISPLDYTSAILSDLGDISLEDYMFDSAKPVTVADGGYSISFINIGEVDNMHPRLTDGDVFILLGDELYYNNTVTTTIDHEDTIRTEFIISAADFDSYYGQIDDLKIFKFTKKIYTYETISGFNDELVPEIEDVYAIISQLPETTMTNGIYDEVNSTNDSWTHSEISIPKRVLVDPENDDITFIYYGKTDDLTFHNGDKVSTLKFDTTISKEAVAAKIAAILGEETEVNLLSFRFNEINAPIIQLAKDNDVLIIYVQLDTVALPVYVSAPVAEFGIETAGWVYTCTISEQEYDVLDENGEISFTEKTITDVSNAEDWNNVIVSNIDAKLDQEAYNNFTYTIKAYGDMVVVSYGPENVFIGRIDEVNEKLYLYSVADYNYNMDDTSRFVNSNVFGTGVYYNFDRDHLESNATEFAFADGIYELEVSPGYYEVVYDIRVNGDELPFTNIYEEIDESEIPEDFIFHYDAEINGFVGTSESLNSSIIMLPRFLSQEIREDGSVNTYLFSKYIVIQNGLIFMSEFNNYSIEFYPYETQINPITEDTQFLKEGESVRFEITIPSYGDLFVVDMIIEDPVLEDDVLRVYTNEDVDRIVNANYFGRSAALTAPGVVAFEYDPESRAFILFDDNGDRSINCVIGTVEGNNNKYVVYMGDGYYYFEKIAITTNETFEDDGIIANLKEYLNGNYVGAYPFGPVATSFNIVNGTSDFDRDDEDHYDLKTVIPGQIYALTEPVYGEVPEIEDSSIIIIIDGEEFEFSVNNSEFAGMGAGDTDLEPIDNNQIDLSVIGDIIKYCLESYSGVESFDKGTILSYSVTLNYSTTATKYATDANVDITDVTTSVIIVANLESADDIIYLTFEQKADGYYDISVITEGTPDANVVVPCTDETVVGVSTAFLIYIDDITVDEETKLVTSCGNIRLSSPEMGSIYLYRIPEEPESLQFANGDVYEIVYGDGDTDIFVVTTIENRQTIISSSGNFISDNAILQVDSGITYSKVVGSAYGYTIIADNTLTVFAFIKKIGSLNNSETTLSNVYPISEVEVTFVDAHGDSFVMSRSDQNVYTIDGNTCISTASGIILNTLEEDLTELIKVYRLNGELETLTMKLLLDGSYAIVSPNGGYYRVK